MNKEINKLLNDAIEEVEKNRVKVKEQAYIAKLQAVLDFKRQAEEKREEALSVVARLEVEIAELNSEYIQETKPKKLESLAVKRKELRVELLDKQGVADTEFMHFVKEKLDAIEQERQEMSKELIAYGNARRKLHEELLDVKQMVSDAASRVYFNGPTESNEANSLERQIKAKPKHQRELDARVDRTLTTSTVDGW